MKGHISIVFEVECLNCEQQLQLEIHPLSEFTKNLKSHGWKTTSKHLWKCPECIKSEGQKQVCKPASGVEKAKKGKAFRKDFEKYLSEVGNGLSRSSMPFLTAYDPKPAKPSRPSTSCDQGKQPDTKPSSKNKAGYFAHHFPL